MTETETKKPTFAELELSEPVARAVAEHGYENPTPVQAAAFGPALAGKDLVVQARTGTGKTAAFGLPLVTRTKHTTPAVQALILCPTRELALQVTRELEALARYTELAIASVYGGASITKQLEELGRGAHIVVGTPGRVLDHLERRTLDVSQLRSFVLDECDEMLSMGFLPQITRIWDQLPAGHQTLLFSATVPRDVTRIADTRLREPEFITLSGDHIGALEIQHFVYLSHGDKLSELLQVIEVENPESAIIFCNTRDETKRVATQLKARGFDADWLNADLSQAEREQVMTATREGRLRFLVCTDVAARGIDISHLTHVINYDFPDASEQYVHRTGRTGRAGRMGTAISLLQPGAIGDLYYLRLKYKISPQERHLPTRQELETRKQADVIASLSLRFGNVSSRDPHYQLARRLLASDQAEQVVAGLLREQLGDQGQAEEQAAKARRERLPRPVSQNKPDADDHAKPRRGSASPTRPGPSRGRTEPRGERRRERPASTPRSEAGREPRPRKLEVHDEEFRYEVSDLPPAPSDDTSAESPPPRERRAPASQFISLYVGVGKRDGARLEDLQMALDDAGVAGSDTGRILVKQRHSFVEVKPEVQDAVIAKLNGISICGRQALVEPARPRE